MTGWVVQMFWGTAIGAVTGGLFFGGLWWTVHVGLQADRPGWWFAVSGVLRFALALVAFWGALQIGVASLACAMITFLMVRMGVIRLTGEDALGTDERAHHNDEV